tara:strand:- start:226 stop:534 length:309 start_codon:yes stop_codon:yes gene_type:complete
MKPHLTKKLKKIAHHLKPIVYIGENGINENILAETNRALMDHELIKIKIHSDIREERNLITEQLIEGCSALLIQKIGKMVVLYRQNPDPKRHLSNVSHIEVT